MQADLQKLRIFPKGMCVCSHSHAQTNLQKNKQIKKKTLFHIAFSGFSKAYIIDTFAIQCYFIV